METKPISSLTLPTAYAYVRFSNLEQAKGRSEARQLERAQAYCKSHGMHLDRSLPLSDSGISAFKGKNKLTGRLSHFLSLAESGKIRPGSALLIESLDRLSREDIERAQELFKRILKCNVNIITLHDDKVYTHDSLLNPFALIEIILYASRAHEESLTKSKRVSDAWRAKRQRLRDTGAFFTKRLPAWLCFKNGKISVIPTRVNIINTIFSMASKGMGPVRICQNLNKRHVPTFNNTKRQVTGMWATSYINKLLHDRRLLGEYQAYRLIDGKRICDGEPVQNYFPVVLSNTKYYSIQPKHKRLAKGPTGSVNNLFTGLLQCGYCHGAMHFVDKSHGDQYLVCDRAKRGGGCKYYSYRYPELEYNFLYSDIDALPMAFPGDDDNLNQQKVLQDKIKALESQINVNRLRIKRLMIKYSDLSAKSEQAQNASALIDTFSNETESLKEELSGNLSSLAQIQNHLQNGFVKQLIDFRALLKGKNRIQVNEARLALRSAIREVVESIILFPVGANINKPDKTERYYQIKFTNAGWAHSMTVCTGHPKSGSTWQEIKRLYR